MNNLLHTVLLPPFLLTSLLAGQQLDTFAVAWARDTVVVQEGDSIFPLCHDFVIAGSEKIQSHKALIKHYRLETVSGRVVLPVPLDSSRTFIVTYQHLKTPFRTRYAPAIASLPRLEKIVSGDENRIETSQVVRGEDDLSLVADGTIFRGMTLSPFGGTELNGGLRFSLQGHVTDDMTITGTLSDQNSPIQPEGNTQTLNEIDKVYLEVTHPFTKIVAGDIDVDLDGGQFLTLSRRLQGLRVRAGSERTNLNVIAASSKGKFHKVKMMGEDQNQGPYLLFSETGGRGIVIMAGSEKVWLDGEPMVRGENSDYTIDYSQGEITFTPKHIIDSNSRIYVEYEYSDFVYPRQVASMSFKRKLTDGKSSASLTWVRERDNPDSQLASALTERERDLLSEKGDGDAVQVTAARDSTGDYITASNPDDSSDSMFVYVPADQRDEGRTYYRISFYNAGPSGEYSRHATTDGKIFFQYVPEEARGSKSDLYVPWKTITSPHSHQVASFVTHFYLSDSSLISLEFAGSLRDKNLFSATDDRDNGGFAGQLQVSHSQALPGKGGIVSLSASARAFLDHFFPLQRDESIEFSREWNLVQDAWSYVEEKGVGRNLSEIEVKHALPDRLTTSVSLGTYSDMFQTSRRLRAGSSFTSPWAPEFRIDITEVSRKEKRSPVADRPFGETVNESVWRRYGLFGKFLPGEIHPYVRFEGERKTSDSRFEEMGGGVMGTRKHFRGRVGVVKRSDLNADTSAGSWLRQSDSWLGELDLSGRWRSGFHLNLVLKQHLKSYADARQDLSYALARGIFGYNPRSGAIRGNLDFKLEQTLFEEKMVVYDSVGIGRGSYRYDPNYGTYFSDPNGHFVAFHVPSGKRTPSSHLRTGLRIAFDFNKWRYPLLRHTTWRLLANTDFNGSVLTLSSFFDPSPSQDGIHQARITIQQDLNYVPRRSRRRIRLTSNRRREVLGLTLKETFERNDLEYSLSLEEPLSRSITLVTDGSLRNSRTISSIVIRTRDVEGWFVHTGFRWRSSRVLEVGADLKSGGDRGSNFAGAFYTRLAGVGAHALVLPGQGGRIEGSVDYYHVTPGNAMTTTLPPEAAQGMQVGHTVRTKVTALLLFGQNLSADAHVSYIVDPLYDGLLTLTGEIRATF